MAKAKSATSRRINLEELKQSLLQDEEFLAAIAATLPAPAQFPGFAGAKQQDYSGIEARSNPGPKPDLFDQLQGTILERQRLAVAPRGRCGSCGEPCEIGSPACNSCGQTLTWEG